ncbi:MAG: peptide-methionine (S)-S-oxide reductase [SAR324 cluster bacterium]|nr:peptide-methionine (S)-S-oxide reductase [SAR324 cluster bacterium]
MASKEAAQRSGRFEREIMTEITPASQFYMAEDYHQLYFQKRARKVFGLF